MKNKPLHIGIIAGEASGDRLGAGLMRELKKFYPEIIFEGVGGEQMMREGCHSLYSMHALSLMGIAEIILHLPRLLKIRHHLKKFFLQKKPDLFIGIDLPDFNLSIEESLKKAGIKTAHYVSPTVWAWREGRMKKIKRAVDLMLGIFPFEKNIYQQYQVPYEFVGNPLADEISVAGASCNLSVSSNPQEKVLAILPGSRHSEIQQLTRDFLEAADLCRQKYPDLQIITSMVNLQRQKEFEIIFKETKLNLPIKILPCGLSHEAMAAADVILLASGTATLEALLFEKPMVVAYRVNWLSYFLAKCLIKVKHVSMPNLLAGHEIVPEFLQKNCTPKNLSEAVMNYFENPDKINQLTKEYQQVRKMIQQNANVKAAKALVNLL